MAQTKARIRRSTGDPVVPWALEIPPAWGRPEDVCDGYDPDLDGRRHVPGSRTCDHPFMGLYGYTTWETHERALEMLDQELARIRSVRGRKD